MVLDSPILEQSTDLNHLHDSDPDLPTLDTEIAPVTFTVRDLRERLLRKYQGVTGTLDYLREAELEVNQIVGLNESKRVKALHRSFRRRFLRGDATLNMFRGEKTRAKDFRATHKQIANSSVPTKDVKPFLDRPSIRRGGGAFGKVDEFQGIKVAKKTLTLENLKEPAQKKAKKRFVREKDAAQRLMFKCPGISPALLGEGVDGDGKEYFLMEAVEGETLDSLMKSGNLTREQIYDLLIKITIAFDHMHVAGVVHRDVKPSNIMVTKNGEVKIIDLGMVKFLDKQDNEDDDDNDATKDDDLTKTGDALGTPEYMSIDQMRNAKAAHPRNDKYSLGLILYRLLAKKSARKGLLASDTLAAGVATLFEHGENPDFSELSAEEANAVEAYLGKKSVDPLPILRKLSEGKRGEVLARIKRGAVVAGRSVKNFIRKPVVYVASGLVALFGGAGATILYYANTAETRAAHDIITGPPEEPDEEHTKLSYVTFADGSRAPVLMLPKKLGGTALTFNRAVNYFRNGVYVGSSGSLQGVSDEPKAADYVVDENDPNNAILKSGNGLFFHREGSRTTGYFSPNGLGDEKTDAMQHCSSRENFTKAGADSPMRKLFGAMEVDAPIEVRRVNESLILGMGIQKDEEWTGRFKSLKKYSTPPVPRKNVKQGALAPRKEDFDLVKLQMDASRRPLATDELRQVLGEHEVSMNTMPDPRIDPKFTAFNTPVKDFGVNPGSLSVLGSPEDVRGNSDTGKKGA